VTDAAIRAADRHRKGRHWEGKRMFKALVIAVAVAAGAPVVAQANDAQIAHVAYTAGKIDIAAGKEALARSHNKAVRTFAEEMVRDHTSVNDQALALVKKLHVTPADNPTSQALSKDASARMKTYAGLKGKAFDRAYASNEVAYHKTVNSALEKTLIPGAQNPELKKLLQTGLKLFTEHQHHAEQLVQELK
jgi:putative membrane protein